MKSATYLRIPKLGIVTDYPDNRLCLTNGNEVLDVSTPIYARTPDCFFVKLYELTANWMDRQRDYRVTFFCEQKVRAGIQLFTGQEETRLSQITAGTAPTVGACLSFKLRGLNIDVLQIKRDTEFLYAIGRGQVMRMQLQIPEDLYFFTYAVLDLSGLAISDGGVVPLTGQPLKSAKSYFEHNPVTAVSGLSQLQQVLPMLVSNWVK